VADETGGMHEQVGVGRFQQETKQASPGRGTDHITSRAIELIPVKPLIEPPPSRPRSDRPPLAPSSDGFNLTAIALVGRSPQSHAIS
jgi:hypothetical protein